LSKDSHENNNCHTSETSDSFLLETEVDNVDDPSVQDKQTEYTTGYKLKGGMKVIKRKRAKIIRSVRFNKEKDPENYYREQLMLYTSWRNEQKDLLKECQTYQERYQQVESKSKENIPGLMLFVDFQKAFDSVEWEFLLKCLETFNFSPDFLRWVRVFYKNIQSCVINNGMTSYFFTLEQGVRQGDALSTYLFVVSVETLAFVIRQNPDIKGIAIGKEETKLLQYADDTTAILSDTDSAKTLFKLLDLFHNMFQVLRSIPQKPRVCG